MVKPTKEKLAPKSDTQNAEPIAVYDPMTASRSRRPRTSDSINPDDVIVSLADAYENKRARQVVEWVRQQSIRRAS